MASQANADAVQTKLCLTAARCLCTLSSSRYQPLSCSMVLPQAVQTPRCGRTTAEGLAATAATACRTACAKTSGEMQLPQLLQLLALGLHQKTSHTPVAALCLLCCLLQHIMQTCLVYIAAAQPSSTGSAAVAGSTAYHISKELLMMYDIELVEQPCSGALATVTAAPMQAQELRRLAGGCRLQANILTPTTKAEDHDVPIAAQEILQQGLMSDHDWQLVSVLVSTRASEPAC